MTTIFPEEWTGAACGEAATVFVCHSYNNFGGGPCIRFLDHVTCSACGHEEPKAVIEFLDEHDFLEHHPGFEEDESDDPGGTEVTFGTWIPGSKRPPDASQTPLNARVGAGRRRYRGIGRTPETAREWRP